LILSFLIRAIFFRHRNHPNQQPPMPHQDWIRVLRGIGLVAEHAVKNAKPLEDQSKKALAHAVDLCSLLPKVASQVAVGATHHPSPPPKIARDPTTIDLDNDVDHTSPAAVPPPVLPRVLPMTEHVPAVPLAENHDHVNENDAPPLPTTSSEIFSAESMLQGKDVHDESIVRPASVSAFSSTQTDPSTVSSINLSSPSLSLDIPTSQPPPPELTTGPREWTEKHVPATPLARILGFGSLAARLAAGTVAAVLQHPINGANASSVKQAFVSDANAERLADALCTMRGVLNDPKFIYYIYNSGFSSVHF
jgi:hypothetical protein